MTNLLESKSVSMEENSTTQPFSKEEERKQRKRESNLRSMRKIRGLNKEHGLCRCGRELDKMCFRCQRMNRDKKASKAPIVATKRTITAALEMLASVKTELERTPSLQAFQRWIATTEADLKEKMK